MVAITALLSVLALAVISPVEGTKRGIPWATDNRWAPKVGNFPRIEWYHHWQDGKVNEMPGKVEFVPMFWGPRYWDKWHQRKGQINKKLPKNLMAFNEPDVKSQSNMNPYYAADLYMQEINPFGHRGVRLGSPAIVWDLNWMKTFLDKVKKKGGKVDFLCIHWYGSYKDVGGFKKFVSTAYDRFKKPIWITEVGITTASHPSDAQVKTFMMNAFKWMDTKPWIHRAAWFGGFASNNAPDGFATGKNAFFKPGGAVADKAFWYGYNRRSLSARHHTLYNRDDVTDEDTQDQWEGEAVDCDEICELRNQQLAEFEASGEVEAREPEPEAEAEAEPEAEPEFEELD